jgi:hypothetical protein
VTRSTFHRFLPLCRVEADSRIVILGVSPDRVAWPGTTCGCIGFFLHKPVRYHPCIRARAEQCLRVTYAYAYARTSIQPSGQPSLPIFFFLRTNNEAKFLDTFTHAEVMDRESLVSLSAHYQTLETAVAVPSHLKTVLHIPTALLAKSDRSLGSEPVSSDLVMPNRWPLECRGHVVAVRSTGKTGQFCSLHPTLYWKPGIYCRIAGVTISCIVWQLHMYVGPFPPLGSYIRAAEMSVICAAGPQSPAVPSKRYHRL